MKAPAFAKQPVSLTVCERYPASFSVTATGDAPFSYQWRFNNGDIFGATNTTFSVADVGASDAGNYDVVVSNARGSVISAP